MARPVSQLLDTLASTLTALREALTPTTPSVKKLRGKTGSRRVSRPSPSPAAARKTAATLPARRKTKTPNPRLALQGKYMAAVRGLSAANKAKVKKVLAAEGVEAAIAFAQAKKA